MTLLGKIISLFPALHILGTLGAAVFFVFHPTLGSLSLIPFFAYALPLLTFRLHQWVYPLKEGTFSIAQGYSPWFGTHMIQQGFIAFPALENLIRLIPGGFSFWLRLWGAKIGANVYFAPGFEIADRSLLTIGDSVIFGYGVKLSSHFISPSRSYGGMKIYIKRVQFGNRCLVGATARFGPGVQVMERAMVRATTDHLPDTVVEAKAP